MALILANGLPYFNFDTDFRNGIFLEEMVFNDKISKELITTIACDSLNIESNSYNISQIALFMNCGRPRKLNKENDNPDKKAESIERPYSYNYDWSLILSAFLEQYNIDLLEVKMHYWKFMALFDNLHDTEFNKAIKYRMMDLKDIKDKDQKKAYKKLKEYYSLDNYKKKKPNKELDKFNEIFGKEV